MQRVKWDKAYIVGFSMGGGIAAAFGAAFPHLVDGRMAFIASVGVLKATALTMRQFLLMSSIGRSLTNSIGLRSWRRRSMEQHIASKSVKSLTPSEELEEIVGLQTLLLPGFLLAVGSSLAHGQYETKAKHSRRSELS